MSASGRHGPDFCMALTRYPTLSPARSAASTPTDQAVRHVCLMNSEMSPMRRTPTEEQIAQSSE
jgi:hypothetical protein